MQSEIIIGNTISFIPSVSGGKTIVGKVVGIVGYDVAKSIGGDIGAYHANVKAINPAVEAITLQDFFLLQSADTNKISAYASGWITEGSLKVIQTASYQDVRVYGIDSTNLGDLKAYLQTGGYTISVL